MSLFTTETVKDVVKGKIENVVFGYVKIQQPTLKYQSKTEKEYTVDVIVDKATSKQLKKAYPKNSIKELDNADFKEQFKIDPPYPNQDEQYVFKLKANAQLRADVGELSAGDLIPYDWGTRPKVYVPAEDGVEDVTMDKLVANGSKGTVAFKVMTNDYGTFPQLTGILVTDLIEYESTGGGVGSAFGKVVNAKPKQQEVVEEVDEPTEVDEDLPF
jgi:hypothetical protein